MPTDFDELLRIQRQIASALTRETETDAKIELLTIIGSLTTGKKKRIPKEAIILEAGTHGLTETQVIDLLEELKKEGIIQEVEEGFISLVP